MAQKTCKQCGSLYDVSDGHVPLKDTRTINCQVCGAELVNWSGSTMYRARLLKAESWPRVGTPAAPAPRPNA